MFGVARMRMESASIGRLMNKRSRLVRAWVEDFAPSGSFEVAVPGRPVAVTTENLFGPQLHGPLQVTRSLV